jgi:hypothetical protein
MPVIPALRRIRQVDCEFKASLCLLALFLKREEETETNECYLAGCINKQDRLD